MAALIAIFLAALLLSFGFAFAAPWLVIVPIAIVIVFVAWLGSLGVSMLWPLRVTCLMNTKRLRPAFSHDFRAVTRQERWLGCASKLVGSSLRL